ncbi:MAG: hypothetical protein EA427_05235 [Spirochaetaceae bacterium]|nr:MAG: hypothetical protein EA427_05235 [Spirochaetaceae bacterium]
MSKSTAIREAFRRGEGVLRLAPNFVPRRFARAGRRLRLHPDDYYALGTARGSIKERWFSSVIPAMNGELAPPDEGLSYVAPDDNRDHRFSLRDAVAELGSEIIGDALMSEYGTWPMYSKFFDYQTPLFHHLHLDSDKAAAVGRLGKPEAYYFPPQLNNHLGDFPVTYFGYDPDVTLQEVVDRLLRFEAGDTRITELSRAYRIELGTGWYTPPGVVHAPGSVLTYEPQWNSDVNSVHENVTAGEVYPYEFLVENCPEEKKRDIDYIVSLMDWEKNIDPHYRKTYFRPPVPAAGDTIGESRENWVVYGNPYFGAKELTVPPATSVTVRDQAAYGCILVQGFGSFGVHPAETAGMLRYGQLSADEFFVSRDRAREGVTITNSSRHEPMVILKHFGPDNREMPR